MAKVLVTGASGFIGSNLCRHFASKGEQVYALVRRTSNLDFLNGVDVTLLRGDLRDARQLPIPADIDYLVHAASVVSDNAGDSACREGIYETTRNLVARTAAAGAQPKRLVYISTALTLGFNRTEISATRPGQSAMFLPYARYKRKTEEFLLEQHRRHHLPLVILRPADVYGPYDRTSCQQMLAGIARGLPLIVGHGRWRFGYCYSGNLCQAAFQACRRKGVLGKLYTVTNRELPTWRQFFAGLQTRMGKRQRVYIPVTAMRMVAFLMRAIKTVRPAFEPAVTPYRIKRITGTTTYDISATLRDLDYHPDEDFESQLDSIVNWYLHTVDGHSPGGKIPPANKEQQS